MSHAGAIVSIIGSLLSLKLLVEQGTSQQVSTGDFAFVEAFRSNKVKDEHKISQAGTNVTRTRLAFARALGRTRDVSGLSNRFDNRAFLEVCCSKKGS